MKIKKMLINAIFLCLFVPLTLVQAENIPVGDRAEPHQEKIALKEQRENPSEEELSKESNLAEAALDEAQKQPIPMGDLEDARLENAKLPKSTLSYYTTHQGVYRRPSTVTFSGDLVTLDDGSCWTVCSYDRYKTIDWLTTDSIIVTPNSNSFSIYDFSLVNLNTGAHCQANLYLGPLYAGLYTYWITAVDYVNDIVYLSDGSSWGISVFDSSTIRKWLLNDTVILGINNDPLSIRPNILINVNVLNYACATCLN